MRQGAVRAVPSAGVAHRPLVVLSALAGALASTLWVGRWLHTSDGAAAAIVFVGASATSIGAVAALAPDRGSSRARALLGIAAALVVASAFAWTWRHPALGVVVDVALVALAHAAGASIGRRVQAAGHLLPASVVAACADLVSVLHPSGPTRALVESERAMNALAFSFPVPGVFAMAPALGVGDLLFVALALGVAITHGLSTRRMAAAAFVGALASGALSMWLARPVPALPAIGASIVLVEPRARQLTGRDRRSAWVAVALSIGVTLGVLLR